MNKTIGNTILASHSNIFVIPDTQRLLTRLKLKYLQKQIDAAIEWNFGHCPNDSYFNALLDERTHWEEIAKRYYPDIYSTHAQKVYCSREMTR
jgi:hypothetical protein